MDTLLSGLTEPARERLALIWKRRAVGECEATARFAAFAERMRGLGVPQRLQDEAVQASEQERRHQEVCLETAHRLGFGEVTFATYDFTVRGPAGPENLLADIVAFCCLSETVNVAMLSTALRDITHPEMRRATRKILGDEVKHSRLGWAYLAWARTQGLGRFLAPHIPQMLWESSPPDLFAAVPAHPDQTLLRAMGDPPMSERCALFVQTINDAVFRGLEEHGVDTTPAREWLAHPVWPQRQPEH